MSKYIIIVLYTHTSVTKNEIIVVLLAKRSSDDEFEVWHGFMVWFGLVWFYGILIILGYLKSNLVYTCILGKYL